MMKTENGWNGSVIEVGAVVRCWDKASGFMRGPKVRVLQIANHRALVEIVKATGAWSRGDQTQIALIWLEGKGL